MHVGVNNLLKVITEQRGGRESSQRQTTRLPSHPVELFIGSSKRQHAVLTP